MSTSCTVWSPRRTSCTNDSIPCMAPYTVVPLITHDTLLVVPVVLPAALTLLVPVLALVVITTV